MNPIYCCSENIETTTHYLFKWPSHLDERMKLLNNLQNVEEEIILDKNDSQHSDMQIQYIFDTKGFDVRLTHLWKFWKWQKFENLFTVLSPLMDRDKIIKFWSVFFNSILTFILCYFNLFSILILKWAVFTFCSINMSSPTIIFPRSLFSTRYKVENSKNYIFRINLVVYLNKFILIEIPGIQTCYVHGDCGFYFQMCKCWW